ncbi:NusG domain II-containing protein [Oribacterium sp. HCP28S3_H8]|uniref:NusG domain II-containing protein n=1 Tax=Oribacterium sp. HCP28S3_H8 TaxID=3438945 RepID=UPI00305E010E|nr:NusG domain II-containing protein [Oribacterium sp.]
MQNTWIKNHKRDAILLVILLIILLGSMITLYLMNRLHGERKEVIITYDGTEIAREPLTENKRFLVADGQIAEIGDDVTLESLGDRAAESRHLLNIVTIADQQVSVTEANCPDHICVQTGPITGKDDGKVIACLPHKLIISVE